MNDILKTLIVDNSIKKWMEFQKLKSFFDGRDKFFDKIILYVEEYFNSYSLFPKYNNFIANFNSSSEDEILAYLNKICEMEVPVYNSEEDFISALVVAQKLLLEMDIVKTISDYQNEYVALETKNKKTILGSVDNLITKLYQIKYKIDQTENSTSSLVYGEEAVKLIQDIYSKIEERRINQEAIYFDIGIKGLEDVQMKRGDFTVIGGYTSQGKSVWLRHIIYQFLVKYHMNCCFFSFEMSHDIILSLFHLLHANNKKIFPGTPYLSNEKFKKGEFSEEEKNFFDQAAKDFSKEGDYGTLFLEQPNKAKFNLIDLQMRIKNIESTIMPVNVIGIDYLSLMYPMVGGNKSPDMEDYNQMIRDFKNYILTHSNREGVVEPIIGLTPAQISRKGFTECLKNDGRYTLDAIRYYSEMEMSADVVFTTLLTDAMRDSSQLRIQNLKHRDGKIIIDPIEVYCDFINGYSIGEIKQRSESEIAEILKTLSI